MSKYYCPKCGSDDIRGAGISESNVPRYHCRECGRRFTSNTAALRGKDGAGFTGERSPDAPSPIEQITREERLVEEVRVLKRNLKAVTSDAVDTSKLQEMIHSINMAKAKPPKWLTQRRPAGLLGTPTLFLSDLHWGEVVFPAQVNHTNQYNLAIAQRRLKRVFDSSVSLLRDRLKGDYDGLVVALGGDMVSGNIHEELRETNQEQILAIVMDIYEHLVAGISQMADEFGRVFVPCVVGNHGRLDKKPRAKGGVRDNFEWILYQFIAKYFEEDQRVTVVVSESLDYMYKVHNTTYLLTHGDQFRGGTGITGPMVPWALGDARKRKRQDAISQPYDVMIFGHWHQLFWGNGNFMCNGSLKGYDEYAFRSNFSYQPPMQALWITHPEKGVTFQMPVLADETPDVPKTEWVQIPSGDV
jgi:hypothetical protein